MKARKTIAVEVLRKDVNDILRNSEDVNHDGREALINLIERVLHATGNYRGFGYLNAEDMKNSVNGVSVGIGPHVSDSPEDIRAQFLDTDHTRVRFYR